MTILQFLTSFFSLILVDKIHWFILSFHAFIHLYTILWKLSFCISPCSETPLAKCDLIMLLYSRSRKKCLNNFENWLTDKDFTPKNDLNRGDCLVLTSPWSKLHSSIGFLTCIRKMKMTMYFACNQLTRTKQGVFPGVNVTCSRPQRMATRPGLEPGTPWPVVPDAKPLRHSG